MMVLDVRQIIRLHNKYRNIHYAIYNDECIRHYYNTSGIGVAMEVKKYNGKRVSSQYDTVSVRYLPKTVKQL